MFLPGNQLTNHCLDNTDISIEKSSERPADQSHPDIRRKANHDHTQHRAHTSYQQDRLPANSIAQRPPEHAGQGLGERKGADEQACIERGIAFVADLEFLDERPSIREDGGEGYGFGEADDGWRDVSDGS